MERVLVRNEASRPRTRPGQDVRAGELEFQSALREIRPRPSLPFGDPAPEKSLEHLPSTGLVDAGGLWSGLLCHRPVACMFWLGCPVTFSVMDLWLGCPKVAEAQKVENSCWIWSVIVRP
ncbi:hypothetical protein TREES_T100017672 [Tupaia chinensis]|uniref:Uncharacterized protein n=1 Tax=Tupaia chinensis TaxID=246437 RepID=L9KXR2_TUPCH|nr:hypothetical protein TREES_T100017672 [Tupaia chinensis]